MNREPTDAEKIAAVKRALREMNDEQRLGALHEQLRTGLTGQVGQSTTTETIAMIKATTIARLRELVQVGKIHDYHDLKVAESEPSVLTVNVSVEPVIFRNFKLASKELKP